MWLQFSFDYWTLCHSEISILQVKKNGLWFYSFFGRAKATFLFTDALDEWFTTRYHSPVGVHDYSVDPHAVQHFLVQLFRINLLAHLLAEVVCVALLYGAAVIVVIIGGAIAWPRGAFRGRLRSPLPLQARLPRETRSGRTTRVLIICQCILSGVGLQCRVLVIAAPHYVVIALLACIRLLSEQLTDRRQFDWVNSTHTKTTNLLD